MLKRIFVAFLTNFILRICPTYLCEEKGPFWEPQSVRTRAFETRIIVYAVASSNQSATIQLASRTAGDYLERNQHETYFDLWCIIKYERKRGESYVLFNPRYGAREAFTVSNMGWSEKLCYEVFAGSGYAYFLFLKRGWQNQTDSFLLDFVNGEDAVFDDTAETRNALKDHIYESTCQLPSLEIQHPFEKDWTEAEEIEDQHITKAKDSVYVNDTYIPTEIVANNENYGAVLKERTSSALLIIESTRIGSTLTKAVLKNFTAPNANHEATLNAKPVTLAGENDEYDVRMTTSGVSPLFIPFKLIYLIAFIASAEFFVHST